MGPALAFVAGLAATAVSGIVLTSHHAGAAVVGTPIDGTVGAEFVAITPCRLMDTRPGSNNVGPRATPLGAGETHVLQVIGTNGNCEIPAASAVALNATAVGGTETSFLTFFPDDAPLPLSSNLNFGPGQAATPNKVDVRLSETGSLGIYNAFGQVNVVVDVMGYYRTPVPVPQPFATTERAGAEALSDTPKSIVSLDIAVPTNGALVIDSWALLGSASGGRASCSIGSTVAIPDAQAALAVDPARRQVLALDVFGSGTLAGSRTVAANGGDTIVVSLVCEREAGLMGVDHAELSAIFVPSFVQQVPVATASD